MDQDVLVSTAGLRLIGRKSLPFFERRNTPKTLVKTQGERWRELQGFEQRVTNGKW